MKLLLSLAVAMFAVGCGTLGLPDSVMAERVLFCKEESCPAQEDVRTGWFSTESIYDAENDECACTMRDGDGRLRTFHVPRRAPADAPLRRTCDR